jgi:hypothetical protein
MSGGTRICPLAALLKPAVVKFQEVLFYVFSSLIVSACALFGFFISYLARSF